MLTLLMQSISNASFGIYMPKFSGTIYEVLSAPISYVEIVVGYVGAAATKSVILGLIIGVLGLFGEHQQQAVTAAVETAVSAGVSSKEAVEHLLVSGSPTEHASAPPPLTTWPTLPPPDLNVYCQIGVVQ